MDDVHLNEMADACRRIAMYLDGYDLLRFEQDLRTHDAVCMNLVRIGEGARLLTPASKAAEPTTPWRQIINMRNFIAHTYALVESGIVWRTATVDAPQLAQTISRMQSRLEP